MSIEKEESKETNAAVFFTSLSTLAESFLNLRHLRFPKMKQPRDNVPTYLGESMQLIGSFLHSLGKTLEIIGNIEETDENNENND